MSSNGKSSTGPPTTSLHSSANGQPSAKFSLVRDQWGQLTFIGEDGKKHSNVAPVAIFPISQPDAWLSIRTPDETELACVEDPRT